MSRLRAEHALLLLWGWSQPALATQLLDNKTSALCAEGSVMPPVAGPQPTTALAALGQPRQPMQLQRIHLELYDGGYGDVSCDASAPRTVRVWAGDSPQPAASPARVTTLSLPAADPNGSFRRAELPLPTPLLVKTSQWVFVSVELGTRGNAPGCVLTCNFTLDTRPSVFQAQGEQPPHDWQDVSDIAGPGVLLISAEGDTLIKRNGKYRPRE